MAWNSSSSRGKSTGSGSGNYGNGGWKMSTSPLLLPVDQVEQPDKSRSSTLPIPGSSRITPPGSGSGSSSLRPKKLRSRTSTMSNYTPPLPPVMSRENSAEDLHAGAGPSSSGGRPHGDPADVVAHLSRSLDPGPSRYLAPTTSASASAEQPVARLGRRASKSVSGSRPTVVVTPAKRTQSYYTPQVGATPTFPGSSVPSSPEVGPNMLKRRTSTPSLVRRYTIKDDEIPEETQTGAREWELLPEQQQTKSKGKGKAVESRARSTSTSIVVPQTMSLTENSTYTLPQSPPPAAVTPSHVHPLQPSFQYAPSLPPSSEAWSGMPVSPPSYLSDLPDVSNTDKSASVLTSAYNLGESSLARLVEWARPRPRSHRYDNVHSRRSSDDSSEKGLNGSEADDTETRASEESVRRPGRYWGMWGSGDEREDKATASGSGSGPGFGSGYFSLPPTPPDELDAPRYPGFGEAFDINSFPATLPTPALSAISLSRGNSKKNKLRKVFRRSSPEGQGQQGWLTAVWMRTIWRGYKEGKTAEVLRELGWTVGILVATFFVTAAVVLWLIQGMPITTLKHIPQSTTDLQLLSAEIRSYMASSNEGWWHTVGVIFFVGCWKHAWSVPGAVVLNILVGSLLDPMPALGLLTLITATGSLGAYTLSRPLAPLISVLFPKPLALVRNALVPESVRALAPLTAQTTGETVTPIQASSDRDPSAAPVGGPTDKSAVWRRLLIMRAMGFVPWSGMNVACGVVGVDWRTFWLTTAAGSASWSYVTASVGHILSRLKVPAAALASSAVTGDASDEMLNGESLTSLLRDPVLIAKLVFLSGLTLLPVILKRRSPGPGPTTVMTPTSTGSVSEGTTPRSSSSFELADLHQYQHPTISSLRLDLDGTGGLGGNPPMSPMSPLSQSLATFTPTPRMFDLLSFGRSAVRQGQRALGAGVRAVRGGQ